MALVCRDNGHHMSCYFNGQLHISKLHHKTRRNATQLTQSHRLKRILFLRFDRAKRTLVLQMPNASSWVSVYRCLIRNAKHLLWCIFGHYCLRKWESVVLLLRWLLHLGTHFFLSSIAFFSRASVMCIFFFFSYNTLSIRLKNFCVIWL